MIRSETNSFNHSDGVSFSAESILLAKSSISGEDVFEIQEKQKFRGEKYISYGIFFWLGVGNLLPWNAFVTAQPYYQARFCNTQFSDSFENFFAAFFTASQPVGLYLLIQYNKSLSINTQVFGTLIVYTTLFVLNTVFVSVTSIPPTSLFVITLASTVCCGFSGAIMNGGLFGLAGMLPSAATSALMNGSSLSGLLVSLVNFLIILASIFLGSDSSSNCQTDDNGADSSGCGDPAKIDYGALAYFIIACVILASCIFLYMLLINLPYVVKNLEEHRLRCSQQMDEVDGWDYQPDSMIVSDTKTGEVDTLLRALVEDDPTDPNPNSTGSHLRRRNTLAIDEVHISHSLISVRPSRILTNISNPSVKGQSTIWRVFWTIRVPALSVFLTFAISLTVFPGIISSLQTYSSCSASSGSSGSNAYIHLWVPLLFLFWNFFDFIGRILAERYHARTVITADNIWILACLSGLMIPLFLFCNLKDSRLPIAFNSDVFPLLFVTAASLLNGFIANLSMIFGPNLVHPQDASLAGTIMVFCLSTGLMFGSAFSFFILFIVTGVVL